MILLSHRFVKVQMRFFVGTEKGIGNLKFDLSVYFVEGTRPLSFCEAGLANTLSFGTDRSKPTILRTMCRGKVGVHDSNFCLDFDII